MGKPKQHKDYLVFPHVEFFPFDTPYYVSVSADYDEDPAQPHVSIAFYPHIEKAYQPSGNDQHWHVPFYEIDARRLRDWLNTFLDD